MTLAGRATSLIAAMALLGVGLMLPASAGADHPGAGGDTYFKQRAPDGTLGTVGTHVDPFPPDAASRDHIAAPPPVTGVGRALVPRDLPSTSCTPASTSTDDTANAAYPPGTPVIKVIYAYGSEHGDEYGSEDAAIMAAGTRAVANHVLSESGGQFSTRFDLGTTEGSECLDVQKIQLPRTTDCYANPLFCPGGAPGDSPFAEVVHDLQPLLGAQGPGPRNYLVYADDVTAPAAGTAGRWSTQDPNPSSLHNSGGLFAVLFGRGGTDFYGSATGFPAGTTSWTHLEFALHEVSHNLGAVGPQAPNTSGATHCNDEYDVLCYEDGGPGSLFLSSSCDGASLPADPYGPSNQAWDCNKDDYFSMNPPAGSYLGVAWNIANSVFLECELASCTRPGIRPAPVANTPVTPVQPSPPQTGSKKKKKKKKKRKRRRR